MNDDVVDADAEPGDEPEERPARRAGLGAADPHRGRVARRDRDHVPVRVPDPFVPRAAAPGAQPRGTQVEVLKAQNKVLGDEARQLQTPSEIERLARMQFNMVLPGEQAYNVVPPAKPSAPTDRSLTRETAVRGS